MSLLLLFHGAAVTSPPITDPLGGVSGGGLSIEPTLRKTEYARTKADSRAINRQYGLIEAKGNPEQFPVTPPIKPASPTTPATDSTEAINAQIASRLVQPANGHDQLATGNAQAQANALMDRLLTGLATPGVAASELPTMLFRPDTMDDEDAYMLMALAMEAMT